MFTVRKLKTLEVLELKILRIFFNLRKKGISKISKFLISALILNWKIRKLRNIFKTCKFQRNCFIWGSRKFPKHLNFRFWLLHWNRKLGKLGNFSKICKLQRMCFTWRSWKFQRFLSFWFYSLEWNAKPGNLDKFI